jgi:hypothetical protein
MKSKLILIQSTVRLTCVWVPTGDLKKPLACVWVRAQKVQVDSSPCLLVDAERIHQCA